MQRTKQQKQKSPARKGQQKQVPYYLPGDAVVHPLASIQVAETKNRSFTMDFNIYQLLSIQNSTSINVYGGLSFKLTDVPNYANWTTIFDKFRVEEVELDFLPAANQLDTTLGAGAVPVLATGVDFDSDTTPASFEEVLRKPKSTTCLATTPFRRRFVPRVARQVYLSGVSTGFSEDAGRSWMDCANAGIPHYGLAYAMGTGSTAAWFYRVNARYRITFAFPIA